MNTEITEFPLEEYMSILQKLDEKHSVFYALWEMGKPEFNSSLTNTAGVCFDENGDCVRFIINPEFWNTQTETQKLFVICHECLHIILKHGIRFFSEQEVDHVLRNQAADIAVNHMAVNNFGFNREDIDPMNKYCWVDTFFDDSVSDKESVEWYYNKMKEFSSTSNSVLVDDHSIGETEENSEGISQDFSSVINKLDDILTPEEKEIIKECLSKDEQKDFYHSAGTGTGGIWTQVSTKPVAKKKKWETVIKDWARKSLKVVDKEEVQWARLNRRFVTLDDSMFIPSDMEIEDIDRVENRIQVWFFQDTSYSCYGYQDRFFSAAKSLPENKFDVRLFCFDTEVYETSLSSGRLYGFGGTCFYVLEEFIQQTIKYEKTEYPKAVFVITDGFGTRINPQNPKNWHWFLTDHNTTSYIPNESRIFRLKDYE